MKIVYVCERSYNLYRTLLKAVNSSDEIDLVITDNVKGMELMYDELRNSGLFNNVYYFNDLTHKTFVHPLKEEATFSIKRFSDIFSVLKSFFLIIIAFFEYLKSQKKAKYITLPEGLNFDKYDEIYITDCTSILNFYLYHKEYKNLIYVEHAKDALRGKYPAITNILGVFVKLRLIYGIRGSCRHIKAIEVNENRGLVSETKNKKIREVPLSSLLTDVTFEQGEFIYQIYAKSYGLNFPRNSTVDMFLTTPIRAETRERVHVHVCKEVIREYMSDSEYIIIKPHPFDKTDYSEILEIYPNVVITPSCFSAEVFALSSSLRIRKLINIDSSAVDAFNSVDEVVTVGYEFVEKCRETL